MIGKWQQRLGPVALSAVGIALATSFTADAEQRKVQRPAARPAARPTARPAAHPAPHAAADQSHHKLRNRDAASFAAPAQGSAWERLGFRSRFLKVGDAWRYAWSFRKRYSILKRRIRASERQTPKWGAPVIIDYRVSKVTTQTLAGKQRRIATITAIYGNRVVGRMQTGNELKVDHYLNPVERCVYTKWTLNGTCRDRDTRSVVRSMGSVPLFLGDIEHERAVAGRDLALNPGLMSLAARYRLPRKQLLTVPVRAGQRVYAMTSWGVGDLVPRFVSGGNIQGVLIGQRAVQ